jgi:nucleoside-diphosphate-sugar epimerase
MIIYILGCGYVGKKVATMWKQQGYTIYASTRHKERQEELLKIVDHVHIIESNSDRVILPTNIDLLLMSVAPDSPADYERTYVDNAKLVVKHVEKNRTLKQVLFTSSTSVYGDQDGKIVTEEIQPASLLANACFIQKAEQILLSLNSRFGIPTTILRISEIIGPERSVIDRCKRTSVFSGTGENPMNFIHVEDLIQALEFSRAKILSGIFNLACDFHPKRKDIYQLLAKEQGLPIPVWNANLSSMHGGNRLISSDKIQRLGFKFRHQTIASLKG